MPRPRILPLVAASTVTLLALTVSGCGADRSGTAQGDAPGPTRSAGTTAPSPSASAGSPAASASSTAPAPPSTPAATPSRTAAGDRGRHKVDVLGRLQSPAPRAAVPTDLAEHLIAAADLPRVAHRTWALADGRSSDAAVGACQKTGLAAIGAVATTSRSFTAVRAAATQVVARFADAASARRAHAVLESWRADCQDRVAGRTVGPLEPLEVAAGAAGSYRSTWTPDGRAARVAGLGILRSGDYVTLVEVTARDRAYPDRWEPARAAVRRLAGTF